MPLYGSAVYGEDVYGSRIGTGGDITVDWELWRATIDNQMVEDVSDLLTGGGVTLNHDRAIKHEAHFDVSDVTRIDPYTDYLAVFLNRAYVDGTAWERDQLGLYAVTVPPSSRTVQRAEGTYTGHDLTAVLARWSLTDTYNIAATTNYITAVTTIMALAGITRHAITATTQALAADRSFPIGTSYLEMCNTLLAEIGYYHLAMARDGRLISMPTRAVSSVQPYRTVTAADHRSPVRTQVLDTTVANVVIVIRDNTQDDILTAVRRNDDADSPTSTVNIGPISRVEHRSELADQAAVDALADRLFSEGRTFYQTGQMTLLPDPDALNPHQVIELDGTGSLMPLNGKWWIRTVSMGFSAATAAPVLEINRVTDSIEGVLI